MRLTIEHNHGSLVLRDAKLVPYQYEGRTHHNAVGIVESGGSMSRLFHASKYTPFEVGTEKSWPIYGRTPRETAPGEFFVSCVFCG